MKNFLEDVQDKQFDYIIVGGGTAGCLIAARLAGSTTNYRVLLVEAGADTEDDLDNLIPGLTFSKYCKPEGNWLYSTTPQRGLGDRVITYPRGRGMGGCSANNFMAWCRGPKVDYNDWAELVGDPWWRWESVLPVLNEMEDFRPQCPIGEEKYAMPSPGAHGRGGPIAVGYGKNWQPLIKYCLLGAQEAGHVVNADHNDGDPVGISVAQFSVDNGVRRTSATAFLPPEARLRWKNLSIVTRTMCTRVLFEGKKAIGVELVPVKGNNSENPIVVYAKKDIVLTAGCFQSPQLLLLSGIGPAKHLASLGIPLVQDLPSVGQKLRDHSALACEFIIEPTIAGHSQLMANPTALAAARSEYDSLKTGPLAMYGASASIIFPRLPGVFASEEFRALPRESKNFLTAKTRPTTEIWLHGGPLFYQGPLAADASVISMEGLLQNCLSRGSINLVSKNPRDLPVIDPAYLAHPYDVRVAVETVKEMIKLANTPTFSSIIKSVLYAPRSPADDTKLASVDDEAVITKWVKDTLNQGFHAMSACVMGRPDEPNKVVNNDFKVVGVEGLRVADMSVCPLLTTNHTQVNAYLIGQRCADMLLSKA